MERKSLIKNLQEDVSNYTLWLTKAKSKATNYRTQYISSRQDCKQDTTTSDDYKKITTTTYSWKDAFNGLEVKEFYKFVF